MGKVGGVVHSHESWPSRLRLMVGPSGVVKLCGTRGEVESFLPKVSRLSCRAGHSGTRQGSCSIEPDRTEHDTAGYSKITKQPLQEFFKKSCCYVSI